MHVDSGYLRIESAADRNEIAAILYKNGYTVKPARRKKTGRSYEYLVSYQLNSLDEDFEENPT